MRKTFVKEHWMEILLGAGILLQILALAVFNLTRLPYESNYDSSCVYAQIVEMWRQKKLVLDHWAYQTTLGLDSPLSLGVLFYGLFKDPFVGMGIANIVSVLLYVYVFYDILKQAEVGLTGRLSAIVFLLTPYTAGQLGYMPMLFTGPGSYAYKLVVPLLFFDILIRMHKGKTIKKNWFLIFLLSVFVLLTAVSSGEYILLCGLVPVFGYEVLYVLIKGDLKKICNGRICLIMAEMIWYLMGIRIGHRIGVESRGSGMTLTPAGKFMSTIEKCITGIFQLFGGVPEHEEIRIMEKYGLAFLCRFFLAVCVLAAWIWLLARLKKSEKYEELVGLVTCNFAVNMIILIFADVTYASETFEYRYHLITMVPMMLLIGPAAEELLKEKKLLWNTGILAAAGILTFVNIYGYKNYLRDQYNDLALMQEITGIAKSESVGLILTMSGDTIQMGRSMRCVEPAVEVDSWQEYNCGTRWGNSTYYQENSHYSGPVMLIVTPEYYEELPKGLRDQITMMKDYGRIRVYYAKENIFDADSRIPEKGTNVDFFYSQGYNLTGDLLENQAILITGKTKNFLRSGKQECGADKFDLKIFYEMKKGTKAWILVTDNEGNVLRKEYFDSKKKELSLQEIEAGPDVEWVRYLFRGDKGGEIKINSIVTTVE